MKIRLSINKSVHEAAARYYQESKQAHHKIKGLEAAIEETKKEMQLAGKEEAEKKKKIRLVRQKKDYEKFHWFFTSEGRLAVGGRNAQQNDMLFRNMGNEDLFFHADIQGGSAVFLKNGLSSSNQEKEEAAQFAASFSNAWKNGNAAVDVYAVHKEQLAKHATGGYVPTGAFAIRGEREWHKNTKLGLKIGFGESIIEILPETCRKKLKNEIFLFPAPAGNEKGKLAKSLCRRFSISSDEILAILPNGKSKTKI